MMDKDPSKYSPQDKARIARTAKRNVNSEAILILSSGFGILMVVLFYFAEFTFLPVSTAIGVRPIIVWITMSFGIASILAWLHLLWFRPIISKANELNAAFQYEYQEELRTQREARYKEVQKNSRALKSNH